MKNIVIVTTKCGQSSRALATALNTRSHGELKATVFNPEKQYRVFSEKEFIFRYGCSLEIPSRFNHRTINTRQAVKTCVSKIKTLEILKQNRIPCVDYTTDWSKIPKTWETIVIRRKENSRKGEDLDYASREELHKFKDAELFTEFFEHKYEYRIIVFNGAVVGRYYKREIDGEWNFMVQPARGFEVMDAACIKASQALGIDYVGYDVVANTKKDFRILEANSGPIITEEAEEAIVSYYLNFV